MLHHKMTFLRTRYCCWFIVTIKRYYFIFLITATVASLLICYSLVKTRESKDYKLFQRHTTATTTTTSTPPVNYQLLRSAKDDQKLERLSKRFQANALLNAINNSNNNNNRTTVPNYNVHVFYYAWYGNLKHDGQYKHWNHEYLPNWKRDDGRRSVYPTGRHVPPNDIGSNYYPLIGCYSSNDPAVIDLHMKQLRGAGIGVVVVSWSPPNRRDSPGAALPTIFERAALHRIKVAIHVEPYTGRNPIDLMNHLRSFFRTYRNHSALYTIEFRRRRLPVIYVYDSYLTPSAAWKEILTVKGNLSVRNTDLDAVYIGLLVDMQHRYHVKRSGFDGFYTYFATNSFTYGSTWKNWKGLAKFATQNGLLFVPSVGPGYVDTQVRPWNAANTRHRRHGQYYDVAWRTALNSRVSYVSITSFNEWHEGTQIEPARRKTTKGYTYLDYEPEGPHYYLNLTGYWVEQFR